MGDLENSADLMGGPKEWRPFECLKDVEEKNIALIKLNTPFNTRHSVFDILWKKACIKAVVDGAINELYNCSDFDRDTYLPDIITGDFDSARPEILDFYRQKGAEIISTPDQNETDFTKCLRLVCDLISARNIPVKCICAHVACDTGRFDHIMANINTLFVGEKLSNLPIYLICGESVTFLVGSGTVDVSSKWRGWSCGLIPINGPSKNITTTGLQYNLDHQEMRFGGIVSTSNSFLDDKVTIETEETLLMTIGIKTS